MKSIMQKRLRSPYTYLYAAFAVFYIWLAAQIPYTHDDWGWSLPIGLERLVQGNINGRYVGNLFEVIMTRSAVAKTVIVGACYFLIPFLLSYTVTKAEQTNRAGSRAVCFVFCNILLLTIDRSTWSETYSWIAGFANFCISAVFLTVWIREIGQAFDDALTPPRTSALRCVGLGMVCILTQLFLENIAIYTVLLALYLCVIYAVRTRRIPAKLLAMLAGAIIGLAITFSSSVYDSLWSTGTAVGGYRRLPFMTEGGLHDRLRALWNQATVLVTDMYESNLVLVLAVLLLLTVLLVKSSSRAVPVRVGFLAANLLFAGYFLWHAIDSQLHQGGVLYADPTSTTALLVNAAFFVLVAAEVPVLFKDTRLFMGKLLTVWFSAPMVILPLVVTSERGARLFFSSDLFIILFAAMLFTHLVRDLPKRAVSCVLGSGVAVCLMLAAFYGHIYTDIAQFTKDRQVRIEQALADNAAVITLPAYVHSEFLCYADPLPDMHIDYFRDYYGIPEDVEIIIE